MENVSGDIPTNAPSKRRKCARHGEYDAEHVIGVVYMPCPECMAENEVAKAAEQEPPPFDREAYRLSVAGITKRFENATFETFVAESEHQRHVLEMIRGYAVDFRVHFKVGRSLVMMGRPGTGKTHLGFSILRQCMAGSDKFTGKLIAVSELFRQIKASWDRGSKVTEAQAIARFVEPHLLIVDEIGIQFDSQTEQSLFYEVINGRYQAVLPTVIISNLGRGELSEVIGARSFDRLRQGGGMLASFDWESRRGIV